MHKLSFENIKCNNNVNIFICCTSHRAIDMLLNQMTSNMDEVAGLRQGLEDRLSKHVDVREALLRKKDEQLQSNSYLNKILTKILSR